MKNRLLFIILAMALPLTMLAQQRYVVTTQELNVRTAPSANSKVVDKVRQGDVVTVVSINNGWAKIVYKKKERYVSSRYLSRLEDNNNQNNQNSFNGQGQSYDLIVLKNGHNIQGKVIEVNKEVVIYQPKDNSINSSVNIAAVQYIRYSNGAQKNFTKTESGYTDNTTHFTYVNEPLDQNSIPETIGLIGPFYRASFEDAGHGFYGLKWDHYLTHKYWGMTLAFGFNFGLVDSKYSAFHFALGPSAIYPINHGPLYLVCPLRFVGQWHSEEDPETGKDKEKFNWGFDLVPGLLLNHNKWSFEVCCDVAWLKGSKKLGTGFLVNIGYEI